MPAKVTRVRSEVRQVGLAEIRRGPEMYEAVRTAVESAADAMRAGAPVRTGAGRSSIRAEVHMGADGWFGTASWDEAHYYLGILNADGRHFAEAALSRIRYV